ncbi:MAG: hypothetical protein KBC17_00325 [Candidatus Pacebacteria bacterium]|nr:hypothetical protein [Candidatus Paceibacterota bacterium]
MSYYKKTNFFHKVIFSRGFALFVIVLVVLVGFGLVSMAQKSMQASKNRKIAEDQALSLTQRQIELTKKIDALNTMEGQETALREQFPVVKEGERVVVITDDEPTQIEVNQAIENANKKSGFFDFLKNLVKKN